MKYLYNLLKLEYESREENAKQNKLRLANFPYKKYIEDLEMEALPEDGRKKLKNFLTLEFIKTLTKYNISWKSRDRKNTFDQKGSELLFSNLSLRAGRKSIIITTNLSFERWNEIFKDPVLTAAMINRLTHKAYIVNMNGNSYRLK